MNKKVEYYNQIYATHGFQGVIQAVENELHIGRVIRKPNQIVCITTGGWSEDEEIIDTIIDILSKFGQFHYIGNIRGGAYYFAEHMECTEGTFEIVEALSDDETRNPKICKWCKHTFIGKRDPGHSITLCDGCRYNEEFEHIPIKIRSEIK